MAGLGGQFRAATHWHDFWSWSGFHLRRLCLFLGFAIDADVLVFVSSPLGRDEDV